MNEIQKFESEIVPIVEETKTLIVSAETYEYAANLQIDIRKKIKVIKEYFKPLKADADKLHSDLCDRERKALAPLYEADGHVNHKITDYNIEEERKRKEKEAELQKKVQAQAEADALERAEEAEKAGDSSAAEAIIENESVAAPVIVASSVPKIDGLSQRKTPWKFRIKDPKKVNPEFLVPDEKRIGGVVRSMGREAERLVGGIEVYQETIMSVRTK